jgi:hypothetical protein
MIARQLRGPLNEIIIRLQKPGRRTNYLFPEFYPFNMLCELVDAMQHLNGRVHVFVHNALFYCIWWKRATIW